MCAYRSSPRSGPRISVALPVAIHRVPPESTPLSATLLDLGVSGALCETAMAPPPVGSAVTLHLSLPSRGGANQVLSVPAEVVRIQAEGPVRFALKFLQMPKPTADSIKRLLIHTRRAGER
jgi:hypothetical protein